MNKINETKIQFLEKTNKIGKLSRMIKKKIREGICLIPAMTEVKLLQMQQTGN